MAVSLATIDVNGMAEAPKWAKVFQSLLMSNFDIFLLQEIHLSSESQGKEWEREWGGGHGRVVSRLKSFGGSSGAFSSE